MLHHVGSPIVQALEAGTSLLLMDEDTCATNFMVRDHLMQQLISSDKEPITPLLARLRELVGVFGVSVVLAVGGLGDYFAVADTVVHMDCYVPSDVSERAKAIATAARVPAGGVVAGGTTGDGAGAGASATGALPPVPRPPSLERRLHPSAFTSTGKVSVRATDRVSFGDYDMDCGALSQLVEVGQTRAIAEAVSRRLTGTSGTGVLLR